jgi:outer membrane protein assembly factor BamB
MPRDPQVLLFVGVKHSVIALDERTGAEVWRAELRSGDYVTVLWDGQSLFAANSGEIWRLDPRNGGVIWHNELKGLGRGLISLASSRRPTEASDMDLGAEKRRRDAEAGAAAPAAS